MVDVARLSQQHPGKLVLLKGVDPEMFWSAIYHRPFRMYGIQNVLVVGAALPEAANFFIDPAAAQRASRGVNGTRKRE